MNENTLHIKTAGRRAATLLAAAAVSALPAAAHAAGEGVSLFDVPAGGVLAGLCTALAAWLAARSGARSRDRIEDARLAELSARVAALERTTEPLHRTIIEENSKIYNRVNEVAQAVYELRGRIEGVD